jgi:hypothetical protein
MFGCCSVPQATFKVGYDSQPDVERLRKLFGEIVRIEERDFTSPRPHRNWVMVKPNGDEEKVCTCPCHSDTGPAVMC